MPEDYSGMKRLDSDKNFFKENCIWYNKSQEDHTKKTGSKRKCLKHPMSVTIILERSHFNYIKKQALKLSLEQNRILHPRELIRHALQVFFLLPNENDA